jgi:hypothetical protein
MIPGILAHAGGLDEMAIIIFPIVVGGGVWMLTRSPGSKKPAKPKVRQAPTEKKPQVFAPAPPKGKRQTFN